VTTDRVAGGVLLLLGLFVIEESWRLRLPLGTLGNPGPAWVPAVLALLVLVSGVAVLVMGGQAPRLLAVGWTEWRHAVAIFGVCAFAALGLERLGYRLTMVVILAVLIGAVERRGLVLTLVFSLALAAGTFFVFDTLLRVPLPRGPFGL
jgi:hypothetical protein